MCGIVGYIGGKQAYPILINGLKRLEYRGYDSAGISLLNKKVNTYKKKGKVADLEDFVSDKDISGNIGIGHTRWATHGEPNDVNAHPHVSMNGHFILIHNGIIENFSRLKEKLQSRGYIFQTDTDTDTDTNSLLARILRELRAINRDRNMPAEFSIGKLMAGVVQMLVIFCLVLALSLWFGTGPEPQTGTTQNCLLLALIFQTLTISLLLIHRH